MTLVHLRSIYSLNNHDIFYDKFSLLEHNDQQQQGSGLFTFSQKQRLALVHRGSGNRSTQFSRIKTSAQPIDQLWMLTISNSLSLPYLSPAIVLRSAAVVTEAGRHGQTARAGGRRRLSAALHQLERAAQVLEQLQTLRVHWEG